VRGLARWQNITHKDFKMRIASPITKPKREYRLLAILHGALVVMSATKTDLDVDGKPLPGKCFICKGTKYFDNGDWAWCDNCGQFAVSISGLKEIGITH